MAGRGVSSWIESIEYLDASPRANIIRVGHWFNVILIGNDDG